MTCSKALQKKMPGRTNRTPVKTHRVSETNEEPLAKVKEPSAKLKEPSAKHKEPSAKIKPQVSRAAMPFLGLIWLYQKLISPLLGPRCRFYPSCSHYAKESLVRHGLLKGGYLAARRCLKCHPFHPGGIDPVPEPENQKSRCRTKPQQCR